MRKSVFLFLTIFIAAFTWAEDVRVHSIVIAGNTFTSESVIRDYITDFREGSVLDQSRLDTLLARVEDRLVNTMYFYEVSVLSVPLKDEPGSVKVIVEVTEGFRYRPGGGNAYAYFGIDNIRGLGKDAAIALGYNAQMVYWQDDHTGIGNVFYGVAAGNSPVSYLGQDGGTVDRQNLGVSAEVGWTMPHDVRLQAGSGFGYRHDGDFQFDDDYSYVEAIARQSVLSGFIASEGHLLEASVRRYMPYGFTRYSADARAYTNLFIDKLTVAGRLAASTDSGVSPDFLTLNLMDHNGVRRNFTAEAFGAASWQFNIELRWKALVFPVMSLFGVTLEPVVFFDAGAVSPETNIDFGPLLTGFGTGIRIYLDAPVYVPIRLEWAWGDSAEPRFYFAVEKPL
jgi:hypothetical protein